MGDHGINELFIRPFRARPGAAFGRKQLAVLPFAEQAMKTQQSRGFQNNSRTKSPRGVDEQRAQPGKDPICGAQVGCPLAPAMEDQQLMPDEHGLGDDGTDSSRPCQPRHGHDQMHE